MVSFPNAKINIGLHVTGRRSDGFHEIQTIFFPVCWKDVLEIVPATDGRTSITQTGLPLPGDAQNNICLHAYSLLRQNYKELPPVSIFLHKAIPAGAGLGGGSADGAFALQMLNNMFSLGLSTEQLQDYALELGSDCPFFILNKPAFASGRGEILKPVTLNLDQYQLVLVNPGIHVNTGWAFQQLQPQALSTSLEEIMELPVSRWHQKVKNDFEPAVFAAHPELDLLKNQLYEAGALYASMSGSGSTVFGIFNKDANPQLQLPPHYFVKICQP